MVAKKKKIDFHKKNNTFMTNKFRKDLLSFGINKCGSLRRIPKLVSLAINQLVTRQVALVGSPSPNCL